MTNLFYSSMRSLYPHFLDCSIQTFDDSKKWRDLARIVDQHKFEEDVLCNALEKYNNMWAWIFFSVNSMQPWKRNKESVTHINAWICECDDFTKEEQLEKIKNCPLTPSLIVESNKSFHMYWFAEDWTKENWERICWWLCNYFGWDNKVIDISRVLRVPGFNHMKHEDAPFMCEITDGSWEYYTEEQMFEAYPDTRSKAEKEDEQRRLEQHKKKMESIKSDGAWYNINSLDAETMLYEISGSSMVNYETITVKRWQIYCNWKATSCWIDRNGLIGSSDEGWPTWVNWVLWYKVFDEKDLYQRVKENHPECIPEKKVETKLHDYKEAIQKAWEEEDLFVDYEYKDVDFETIVPFTWWLDCIDEKFWKIDYWKFVAAVWESWAGKTTYTFFQALCNANAWYKVCYISLEQDPSELLLLKALKRYWVDKYDWDNKTVSKQQQEWINHMIKELASNKNLRITKVPTPTLARLCKAILQAKEQGYVMFYIDNLWIILSDKWNSKEYDMVTECSRVFMTLAHDEKVTIVLLHHFNQWNSVSRYAPRTLADIRGWAKLEHDCDLIFQVWRNLDYEDETKKDITSIIVQKNRQWWTTWVYEVKFNKGSYECVENPL